MAENEKKVVYRAVADFAALSRASKQARKDMADLRKEAEKTNSSQVSGSKSVEGANTRAARSIDNMRAARAKAASSAQSEAAAVEKAAEAVTKEGDSHDKAAAKTKNHASALGGLTGLLFRGASALLSNAAAANKHANSTDKAAKSTVRFQSGFSAMISRLGIGTRQLDQAASATEKLGKKISDVFSKRSQVGGLPFGLLVPIILGVISAINPLISLLGAASGAAIGFANSLASLSGVALALPGIFAGVASGIAGVIVAFGGVGKVFKAFSQKQAGGGGGGGGGGGMSAADRAKQLADAEDRLAKAQRNVQRAQERLNESRKQAIRDLEDLRKAVSRASSDEADAVANLQQAQEAYNNVFADSGSTAGDKLKAAADLKDAQNELDDVRQQNIRNQEDLNAAEKKGVEGSDAVVSAQDNLTDAIKEQNDALYDLKKTQAGMTGGGGGGGGGGFDALQAALDALSPSAREFVLGILAMADAWKELRKNVQENFFSKIVKDLPLISGFLPTLNNLLSKAAGAMGDVAHNGIVMVTSGPWTKDFNTLADNNVGIIHDLGAALLSLLDALRNITLAAAPFTKVLTGRFATAMANLDKLTQTSRDNGSLANWLDKVANRLSQWWSIIKNIGATLFNYGKAASGFGDWLTEGFVKVTEGWKKASEAANDPKSGFKKWLEDIKPLLAEVKGLLGDFWSWLKRTSADPKNIKTATDLLQTIRKELGPALGRLLDTMSKTGISEKLVSGVSKIVDAISKLIEKGGGAGMSAFFSILETFFDIIDKIVSIPGVGETLGTIAGTLAAIAAIKFVAKFSGIEALINLLLSLAGKKGDLLGIFEALSGLDLSKIRGNPATPTGSPVEPVPTGKPGGTPTGIPTGKPGSLPEVFTKGGVPKGGWLSLPGLSENMITPDTLDSLGRPYGDKAYITGSKKGDEELAKKIKDNTDAQKKQIAAAAKKDPGGNIFTNPGGVLGHGWAQIQDFFANGVPDFFNGLFNPKTPTKTVAPGGGGGKGGIAASGRGGLNIPSLNDSSGGGFDIGKILGNIKLPDFGKLFSGFKMPDLGKVFTDLNPFKGIKLPDFGAIFKGQNPFGFLKLPDFGGLFKGQNPFSFLKLPDFGSVFKGQNPFGFLKLPDFGGVFKGQIPGIKWPGFSDLFSGKIPGLSWPGFSNLFSGKIPGLSWPNFGSIFGSILPSAWTIANQVYQAVAGAFNGIGGIFRSIFGSKGGQVKNAVKAKKNKPTSGGGGPVNTGTGGRGKGAKAFWTGGYAALASGGRALENRPGSERPRQVGTDTVPAMLTLGEFVLRKGVVDSIGTKNLNALNEGLISYSDMLNMAMGNQKTQQKQKSKYTTDVAQYLSGGGLAGSASYGQPPITRIPANEINLSIPAAQVQRGMTVENLNIHNPKPERASDSLPRTIRKVGYLGDRKPATPRVPVTAE